MDYIIILCAGAGSRAALGYNKIFYPLGRGTVLDKTIERFKGLGRIILAVSASDKQKICDLYPTNRYPNITVVQGGKTRTESVRNAFAEIEKLEVKNITDFNTQKNFDQSCNKNSLKANADKINLQTPSQNNGENPNLTVSPEDCEKINLQKPSQNNGESFDISVTNSDINTNVVAIHDCARPFVTPRIIKQAMESARKNGSGIPAVKTVDSIAAVDGGKIINNLKKDNLVIIQTPQCFRLNEILDAYNKVKGDYADDSEVYRLAGYFPTLTDGEYINKKLTTPEDFAALNPHVAAGAMDFHQLVEGRKLILGGITIPYEKGLLGHSDADVVAHAITDSVLGAANMPDIGVMFPDTDPAYKGIDSLILLDKALELLRQNGREVVSASCVIMAQKPKLAPYIADIRANLAKRLGIGLNFMLISATTTEFLGVVGEGKGIAANAMVLYKQVAPLKVE